jgi:invasion protein IalB
MTNSSRLAVVVHVPPETRKPVLLVVLPVGLYLPAGVTIQFGQDPAKMVPVESCDGTGCLAEYAITDAELAGMIKGQPISVSVQNASKQPMSVQVPSSGFAAAYAKVK